MLDSYFSLNSELIPTEKATIPLDNIEFAYGYGVYESLKTRKGIVYFPEHHAKRLLNSAKYIGLKCKLKKQEIEKNIIDFAESLENKNCNIKILLIGNGNGSDMYIFATNPLFIPKKMYKNGVKVTTFKGERQFTHAKTLNMLMSYIAYKNAKEKSAYDALLVDDNFFIREGTRTNLFYTDGEALYTPPEEHVLEGVTKITLKEALKEKKIRMIERSLHKDELNKFNGYFLTSTSAKILPISKIDDEKFEIPAIIKNTIKIYNDYLSDYSNKIMAKNNS